MIRYAITQLMHNDKSFHLLCGLDESRKLQKLQVFPAEEESLLDRIYVGRVENVVANINAAFVRLQPDLVCYLDLKSAYNVIYARKNSKKDHICQGDEILVQVIRDAIKTKAPVVSTNLTLHGTYSLLTTGDKSISVSKKIAKDKAEELKALMVEKVTVSAEADAEMNGNNPAGQGIITERSIPREYGLLCRTNAANVDNELVAADLDNLIEAYQRIKTRAIHFTAYSLVWKNPSAVVQGVKSIPFSDFDCMMTDQRDIYDEIGQVFPVLADENKLVYYQDEKLSLSALYGLEHQLDRLLKRQVWLRSGANIIIEQLETLTFIDVNTAKNVNTKNDAILKVNKEAAAEAALQIRLRNISGMILIDFINMKTEEQEKELIHFLKGELARDHTACSFIDITRLGLVEITRKKVSRSLKEILG